MNAQTKLWDKTNQRNFNMTRPTFEILNLILSKLKLTKGKVFNLTQYMPQKIKPPTCLISQALANILNCDIDANYIQDSSPVM